MIAMISLLLLISVTANAAERGRIISEVNFRKAPDRSASSVGKLPGGEEVEVIKHDPTGWYFVRYGGRSGFVHEHYLKIEKENDNWRLTKSKQTEFIWLPGIAIALIGAASFLSLAPFILRVGAIFFACTAVVFLLDLAFKTGFLYSLISVVAGLLIVVAFWFGKNKPNHNQPTIKNAA